MILEKSKMLRNYDFRIKKVNSLRILESIFGIAVFLILCADLKVTVFSYIHWVIVGIAIILAFLFYKDFKISFPRVEIIFLSLIPFSMGLNFLFNPTSYDVTQTFKILFVLSIPLVFAKFLSLRVFIRILILAVFMNTFLLFAGILGFSGFAKVMAGDGRWGTILVHPGSLYKLGLISMPFLAFAVIFGGKKIQHFIGLMACLFLIIMDGSRTAFIILGMMVIYMMGVVLLQLHVNSSRRNFLRVILTLTAILSCGVMVVNLPIVQSNRLYKSISLILSGGSSGLEQADPTRFRMLEKLKTAISEHPVLGSGMGTNGDIVDGMLMTGHNAYLQLWADGGIFAFCAFIILLTFGVFRAISLFGVFVKSKDIMIKAIIATLAFILLSEPILVLFHPFSTEWSEWTVYVMALGYSGFMVNKSSGGQKI